MSLWAAGTLACSQLPAAVSPLCSTSEGGHLELARFLVPVLGCHIGAVLYQELCELYMTR